MIIDEYDHFANDLTSGFNNADNLSLEQQYNEMMGFIPMSEYETGADYTDIFLQRNPKAPLRP